MMRAPVVPKLPLPDFRSLFENSRYSDSYGEDDYDDDSVGLRSRDDLVRFAGSQPARKRTRGCLTERSGEDRDTKLFDDVTPQRILPSKVRLAMSEKVDKGERELRCPDTPARTPLRRSFRGQLRSLVNTPESNGMSLSMIEIVNRLGEGSYGVVYKARFKEDNKLYALKIMKEGYVSMPGESGVTKLKYSRDNSPVDPYHFYKTLTLKDSPPSKAPATSLLVPQPPAAAAAPVSPCRSRAPATSLLVPQQQQTTSPESGTHEEEEEEPEPFKPKPIPFTLDDGEDNGADDIDFDVDDDDDGVIAGRSKVVSSPKSCSNRVGLFPVKRRQMCEAEHQSSISGHPNIVAIKAFWEEPDGHFCILSELCGSSLSTIISRNIDGFDEKTIAGFARDLLSALAHIHKHGVIHLDIKPANILISLDGSCLKITDFGQAYKIGSKEKPEEGDGRYLAPEVLKDIYTTAADIFSLGMTLYELCTPGLVVPLQGERWSALRQNKIDFRMWHYSEDLKELIKSMLTANYLERPSAEKLLASKYFKTILCDSPEVPFSEDGSPHSASVNPRPANC